MPESPLKDTATGLSLPFRKTYGTPVDALWHQDSANSDGASLRRMRRRIEKEVLKQEMLYHRQQMEIKIKSLEAICELQSEKISRIQA